MLLKFKRITIFFKDIIYLRNTLQKPLLFNESFLLVLILELYIIGSDKKSSKD